MWWDASNTPIFYYHHHLLPETKQSINPAEINKVRSNLFHINGGAREPLILPDASGPTVNLSEKVYVPVKEHPDVSN